MLFLVPVAGQGEDLSYDSPLLAGESIVFRMFFAFDIPDAHAFLGSYPYSRMHFDYPGVL